MEGTLKFLVVLSVLAGILWVISPIVSAAAGSVQGAPEFRVVEFNYSITPIPDSECSINMCEIIGNGSLYNSGAAAKNILLTVFFFDVDDRNLGSVNLPLINILEAQSGWDFSVSAKFSCSASKATASVIHSEKV